MIRVGIGDSSAGETAQILDVGLGQGILAYTSSAHGYTRTVKNFTNDDFGVDMNQDASPGGTPINIHNGTDNAYYTATDINGTVDFSSTSRPQNGTRSIRWNGEPAGTISQFAGASIDGSSYVAVTFGINVDRRWDAGDVINLYAWDTSGAVQVGNAISIGDYFDFATNDVWQQVTVPMSVMNLTTVSFDSFRIEVVQLDGNAPVFFIDDWQVTETGTPVEYRIPLKPDEIFLADEFLIVASNNVAPGVATTSLFGGTFNTGINYIRKRGDSTAFSASLSSMTSLLQGGFVAESILGAASDTVWSMRNTLGTPLIFDPHTDYATMTITEDFSGLTSLRVSMIGRLEDRARPAIHNHKG